jgi:hypothetical protein
MNEEKIQVIRITHTVIFWLDMKQIGGMVLKPTEMNVSEDMLPKLFDLNGWDKNKAGLVKEP